jgi:hypothetical protein
MIDAMHVVVNAATRVAACVRRHGPSRARALVASSVVLCAATVAAPHAGFAQTVSTGSLNGVTVTVAPMFQSWKFAKDVPLDSLSVSGATQISAPFSVQFPIRSRWNASITGAIASSKLDARDSAGTVSRTFTGLSDLRVRATGALIGNALQLTLGVNIPTGAVNLSAEQNDVMRVTAAPALDAQVPIAGTGLGGTIGLVYSRFIGEWAWALGASVEQRGTYSPLDAQIAGVQSRTELNPGSAAHFSVGTDGLVGQNRLSVGVVTDIYGADELHVTTAGNTPTIQQYHLGPTISAGAALDVKNPVLRDLTLSANERYRQGFKNALGTNVDGSSGNYFDAGAAGYLGAPNKISVLLGLNVRQQSGLPVDKGFIGAGLTAVGGTVGLSIPSGTLEWRPTIQLLAGSLKTALVTTGMTSISVGLTVNAR